MTSIVFEGSKEGWRVGYQVATVSLSLSSLQVADIVVLMHDQLSFAVSFPLLVVSFVREWSRSKFTKFVTIAMVFAGKELSRVINLMSLLQHANSLPEPIHEMTGVNGVFDEVPLRCLAIDLTISEGSLILESSTGL